MKTLAVILSGLVMFALAGCNANAPKIGVLNVERAVDQSNQGKAANAELHALIKVRRDELKQKAKDIEALKKKLQKAPSSAKKANKETLTKANADYQKLLNSSKLEIKKKRARLRNQVLQNLQKVIDTIGKEENFQLILTTANVAYMGKTIDITDQVIKEFNKSSGAKKASG